MGKFNKANRTKGNTRPSSSGHSAQLLSGQPLTGFIGFEALEKEVPSYVPVTGQQISNTADNSVDSDFRMVMRKMLKRDAITRLKAMQEFGDYCAEKDTDVVINVLQFWPRLFNRLALDTDRRIREATHVANKKLLAKVKRHIAPYLKNIMGVWLLGQCDLYAPAASSAQAAFSDTFQQPSKQSAVLMFCKAEIFAYFKDNLFEQTVKSMSELNALPEEEMENKYTLVISATLQALKLFLSSIDVIEHKNIEDEFHSIVINNKFWKFAKHKEPQIRGSWFNLVSSICKVKASFFNEMEQKLATSVFSCLSESNPAVAPSVWESALSIVLNFENCWEGIDIHKVALPHLWSLLKEGGKGNARVLFPCLLPFMSKLPQHVQESETFLLKIFSSFQCSLKLDSVIASSSECDAILVAFFECLQYICCTRLGSTSAGPALLKTILVNEIVPLVESSLYESKCCHLPISQLYPLLSSLIQKMENERASLTGEMSECYSETLTAFWEAMLPVANKYFEIEESVKESALAYISYLFNCLLQTPDSVKTKRKKSVRFKIEEDEVVLPEPQEVVHLVTVRAVSLSDKQTLSFKVIAKFCVGLCNKISSNCNIKYLRLLEEMLSSASSSYDLVEMLVKDFSDVGLYEPESPFGFFQNVVLKWVEVSNEDEDNLGTIFRSIFTICSQVPEEEAWKILNCCCKTNILLLEQVLQNGILGLSQKKQPFFKTWLLTSQWSSEVVSGLQELVSGKKFFCDSSAKLPISIYHRILSICISDVYERPLLDDASFETIIQLIHTLCDELVGFETSYDIDLALKFIHDVTIAILQNSKVCWNLNAISTLVYRIFEINFLDVPNFKKAGDVSKKLYEILDAFVDSYVKSKEAVMSDDSLICKMSEELRASLQSLEIPTWGPHLHEQCTFLISSVQKAVAKHKPELSSTSFVSFTLLDKLLPTEEVWNSLMQGLEINPLYWFLSKKICYPLLTQYEFSQDTAFKYSLVSSVILGILDDAFEAPLAEGEKYEKFCVHYISKHLPHLLWGLAFCQGIGISEVLNENCALLGLLQKKLPLCVIHEVMNQIFNLSLTDISWSFCLKFTADICPKSITRRTAIELFEKTSSLEAKTPLHKYAIRQVFIPFLPSVANYLLELLQEISELEEINNNDFLCKMGELCCYFEHSTTGTSEEVSEEMLRLLKGIFLRIIEYDFENKDPSVINVHHMLMISIVSALVDCEVDILCPESMPFFQNLLLSLTREAKSIGFGIEKNLLYPNQDLLYLNQTVVLFTALSELLHLMRKGEIDSSSECVSLFLSQKEVHENMIFLFQHVSDIIRVNEKPSSEPCLIVLRNLQKAVEYIPEEHFVNILVAQHAESEDVVSDSKEPSVLKTLISTLKSNVRPLQFASHTMLMKLMPFLPNLVNEEVSSQSEDDTEEEIRTPARLAPLIELLKELNEIVDSMLLGFKIGDLCTVMPNTDSYVYTMAYLFAWMELFEFFSASPTQVRLGYALHLEEKLKLFSSLFSNLLRLMPENPILILGKVLKLPSPEKEDLKLLFIDPPELKSDTPTSEEIQSVACYVYSSALRKVPAVIRTWFNNLDRKSSDIVNSFTSKYISGLLCMEEIQAVQENEKLFDNLVVQARLGSRTVSATYCIDDNKIELCVQLPINYPLGPISSERRGKVVIGQQEWRHWLMQLTTVLAYQNGTIIDGLNIWKKNLDKKFEGVEECMICYYILHSSTLKLPKLSCHVCRKKFHSACLYKWFRTSNNFTCPLCRNEFAV